MNAVIHHDRLDFEMGLLGASLDGFKTRGKLTAIGSIEGIKPGEPKIDLTIKFPRNYPASPPKIGLETEEAMTRLKAERILERALASWTPERFAADIANELSKDIFSLSILGCISCGRFLCPTCEKPILTALDDPADKIGVLTCPACRRPYHEHCLEEILEKPGKTCFYCLNRMEL